MAIGGTGFLSRVEAKARKWVDDEGDSGKFTSADLYDYIRRHWADTIADINRVSSVKVRARLDISVAADLREYILPPTISTFEAFEKLDANGDFLWEETPRHPLNPYGPGFTIEGSTLRLDPVWKNAETMRITYVPNGEAPPFEATAIATEHDTTTVLVPAAGPIDTTNMKVDNHENAYAGYVFRILSATYSTGATIEQERNITTYEVNYTGGRKRITWAPALSPAPDTTQTMTFEVVPAYAYRYEDLIALRVARFMATVVGDADRRILIDAEYRDSLRSLRLDRAQAEQRIGHRFHRSIRRNRRSPGKLR